MSRATRRAMVRRPDPELSLSRQCRLLSIERSWLYYAPQGESAETLAQMRRVDRLLQRRTATLGPRRENPGRGLPRRPACGYDGQAATRLAHLTHRRSNGDRKIDPRRFWQDERQPEYTLNRPPSCPQTGATSVSSIENGR